MDKNSEDTLTLRVTRAAELLDISRSKAYELVAGGILPSIRIGKSIRVPAEALRKWIADQMGK